MLTDRESRRTTFERLEDGQVRFLHAQAPTPRDVAAIAEQVRRRVLRRFARSGLLDADDTRDMLGWDNGGFSLGASVRIAGHDRAGLERLLRYCARPPFALERLEQVNGHQVIYRLPKPGRDGRTALSLTPLELIDHWAAPIPPPRRHRHRYHGVLAPNSPVRASAAAYGCEDASNAEVPAPETVVKATHEERAFGSPARYLSAMLLARLFESLPLTCPKCGADRHASSPSSERLRDHLDGRWHRGQIFRYLIGGQARVAGINAYEANRTADLLFSAAGRPDLRDKLRGIVRRWDSQTLRELLQQTFTEMLAYHPLLSERRVDRLADALGDRKFQRVFADALEAVRSEEQFAAYLRSVLIHSIAIRLKQSFVLHGRGDERQVLVHAKLPIQFGADAEDVIIVVENGAHGDGTTRMFVENLEPALEDWSGGALAECPNAGEDAIIEQAFRRTDRHAEWCALDPRNPEQRARLAAELKLGSAADEASMQSVMRLFYGSESVGPERFDLYSLHGEISAVDTRLRDAMAREPSQWELVSAAARAAARGDGETPRLAALHQAYQELEEATLEESLGAEARLADQVYPSKRTRKPTGALVCSLIPSVKDSGQ